jgi:hypothetical protein
VGAVLFYRNADDFSEPRLDDETGVRVMSRYRGKRTTLAANELFPVHLDRRISQAERRCPVFDAAFVELD